MKSRRLAFSAVFGLLAAFSILHAPSSLADSREIVLPGVCGDYTASSSMLTGIVFETPLPNAVNARMHLRGTCEPGRAICRGEQDPWQWVGDFYVSLRTPAGDGWASTEDWPEYPTGDFDLVTPDFFIYAWEDPSILRGDTLLVSVSFSRPGIACMWDGDWLQPDWLSPSRATVTYAALIIDTAAPIEASTWGGVKALYGR